MLAPKQNHGACIALLGADTCITVVLYDPFAQLLENVAQEIFLVHDPKRWHQVNDKGRISTCSSTSHLQDENCTLRYELAISISSNGV